jgi:hypothetical protein
MTRGTERIRQRLAALHTPLIEGKEKGRPANPAPIKNRGGAALANLSSVRPRAAMSGIPDIAHL